MKDPGLTVALVLGLVAAVFVGHSVWLVSRMNALADLYYEVGEAGYLGIYEVTGVEKPLVDMETGERGYLLVGERSFLEPCYEGARKNKGARSKAGSSQRPCTGQSGF